MASIGVCIYGYKSKSLIDVASNAIKKQSGNNDIKFYLVDQHQLNRENKIDNVDYDHIFWDNIKNPNEYKNKILVSSREDYFIQMGDGVYLNTNWDENLLSLHKNIPTSIISGNSLISLFIDNYKIKNNKEYSSQLALTNFINRNFIFSKTTVLRKIMFSKLLKYNGEEEEFSCKAFNNNIEIYCLPTEFYLDETKDLNYSSYVPFSLNHGYRYMVKLLKENTKFVEFHNIDINKLKDIPFSTDDVIYDLNKSLYNKVQGEKFYDTFREIN
jgi:hypothetical protein